MRPRRSGAVVPMLRTSRRASHAVRVDRRTQVRVIGQAEGLGQNVKMTAEQLEACDAALRALAD